MGTNMEVSPICFGMMYGRESRKKPELKRNALSPFVSSVASALKRSSYLKTT